MSLNKESSGLCHSLAMAARRICNSYVDPNSILPLLACQLISLDKNYGVWPIGIVDTVRQIIAKAVLLVVKPDTQEASGCLHMCRGQISGIEAVVHAVRRPLILMTLTQRSWLTLLMHSILWTIWLFSRISEGFAYHLQPYLSKHTQPLQLCL